MFMQFARFDSALPKDTVIATAKDRMDAFRTIHGLLQKFYVTTAAPNNYCGIYNWDSQESMKASRDSDIAASIPPACQLTGAPDVQILNCLFQLREPP